MGCSHLPSLPLVSAQGLFAPSSCATISTRLPPKAFLRGGGGALLPAFRRSLCAQSIEPRIGPCVSLYLLLPKQEPPDERQSAPTFPPAPLKVAKLPSPFLVGAFRIPRSGLQGSLERDGRSQDSSSLGDVVRFWSFPLPSLAERTTTPGSPRVKGNDYRQRKRSGGVPGRGGQSAKEGTCPSATCEEGEKPLAEPW